MLKKIGLLLTLTSIAVATTGCQTTGTTATIAPGVSAAKLQMARCAGWVPLTYSAKGDTKLTVTGIRKHNRFGQKRKCWS